MDTSATIAAPLSIRISCKDFLDRRKACLVFRWTERRILGAGGCMRLWGWRFWNKFLKNDLVEGVRQGQVQAVRGRCQGVAGHMAELLLQCVQDGRKGGGTVRAA